VILVDLLGSWNYLYITNECL